MESFLTLEVEGKIGLKASKMPTHSQAHSLLSQNPFFEHIKLTFLFSTLLFFIFLVQGGNIWGN